ncbi:unnamed protein product [Meloidogyne enterolobii]|uniref:Protein kinase domain-containing protein n=3 Tax=Meloidogyne TaxID=189290 RepID=A0A6V7WWP1_MELEN|nr:unnamed protein product [Meloidogyne enterolobii]CAD2148837.1 unnamed protein product [Meloidogyne enterolobii]CAD2148890.1 unnamed protein product [Meloidogyne enterolobii]CAD2148892.1 unnamed protein product [Meloidogyne enterolobii]CAD2191428.1 unnamed protein product [Meloidogyne enterolobii]
MGEEQLVTLQPGQRCNKWTITKKLGAGAFGAVYLCTHGNLTAALKTEPLNANPPLLAMEAQVLQDLHGIKEGKHFTKCHDIGRDTQMDPSGRSVTFNYIVMALVGKSLDKLIEERPGRRFTPGTAIGISVQMVNAIRALNEIGYLHRDLKPANAAIGRADENELDVLYLLDFGMARKFKREDGSLRRPRQASNFRGSPRYAAISAHINREYSRKDDLESWFYMLVEIYRGSLPWGNVGDMNMIGEYKKKRLPSMDLETRKAAVKSLIDGCPQEFGQVLKHIDSLKFYTRPDYKWIMKILKDYLTNNRIPERPYDWEQGGGGGGRAPPPPSGGAVDSFFR